MKSIDYELKDLAGWHWYHAREFGHATISREEFYKNAVKLDDIARHLYEQANGTGVQQAKGTQAEVPPASV